MWHKALSCLVLSLVACGSTADSVSDPTQSGKADIPSATRQSVRWVKLTSNSSASLSSVLSADGEGTLIVHTTGDGNWARLTIAGDARDLGGIIGVDGVLYAAAEGAAHQVLVSRGDGKWTSQAVGGNGARAHIWGSKEAGIYY